MLKKYTRVIVIGYGAVAGEVLQYIHENAEKHGYIVEYIEHEVYPFNVAKKYAQTHDLVFRTIENNKDLLNYFITDSDKKTLIVSTGNNFLFPKELCEKDNITIINFHNALLPDYPGRNAPSRAIYEGQKITGITWHYVVPAIDEGNIIIQKKCEIPWNTKAYELDAILMQLAIEALRECFEDVLLGMVKGRCQDMRADRKVYKSKEIPQDGRFELTDSPQEIYRLFRALDCGKNKIFPLPTTEYKGETVRITWYKIETGESRKEAENFICIPFEENTVLQMKYDVVHPDGSGGGVIDSLESLYELIGQLKRVNRKLASNNYLSESELGAYIDNGELFYSYVPEKYLNIWYKERDFVRLYYCIADLNRYEIPSLDVIMICDQFYQKETEKAKVVNNALKSAGLKEYAMYYKWNRDDQIVSDHNLKEDILILQGAEEGYLDMLEKCFDQYSDCLPKVGCEEAFFSEKKCYSAVLKDRRTLVGGLVITQRGNVQTEEFVFVDRAYRGMGIANRLHTYWYKNVGNNQAQYIAWIRSDNDASITLHVNNGFKRTETYKLTMMKG